MTTTRREEGLFVRIGPWTVPAVTGLAMVACVGRGLHIFSPLNWGLPLVPA